MECYFCRNNIKEIDFKDVEILKRFITALGKIKAKKRTGLCASHQRKISKNIKRARQSGILSSTSK